MKRVVDFLTHFSRSRVVGQISGSILTQAVLSITNFIVAFSVARYAAKSEYGMYVILFSIMGIAAAYQGALINTPLTVLAPKKESTEKHLFLSGLAFGQWLFFLPPALLSIIIGSIYSFFHHDLSILKYILVLLAASSTYLLREFIRTVNYSKLRIYLLVKMDALFVLLIALGIGLLIALQKISCSSSITLLGIGYFLASVFAIFYAHEVYYLRWEPIKKALTETWQYSRWTLVGVTGDLLKTRTYIYIVTASLSLQILADLSAARLFVMPLGLFLNSTGKIILAKGAELLNKGRVGRFKKFVSSICCFLIIIAILYFTFLWLFCDYFISFLGDKYSGIKLFVFLWAIYFMIYVLRYPITAALAACKEFKAMAKYDIISAVITIASCLVLTYVIGGYGTIISLALGELVMFLLAISRLILFLNQNQLPSGRPCAVEFSEEL